MKKYIWQKIFFSTSKKRQLPYEILQLGNITELLLHCRNEYTHIYTYNAIESRKNFI